MPNPRLISEEPLTLVDVKEAIDKMEKRDKELSYRSGKAKDYLSVFVDLSEEKKSELQKKLTALDLVRLKEVHIAKIIDFLPKTADDLKVLLQGYVMTLPKKEMDSIVAVVKEVVSE
jgi:DNA-directed RNA polymerase subunit F